MTAKQKVIVLFGGRSTEHDISCRSAAFVFRNLDRNKYDVIPVGIDRQGHWWAQSLNKIDADIKTGLKVQSEHASGTETAQSLLRAIAPTTAAKEKRLDDNLVVFPIMHGTNCEDGRLQGLLDLADVAYVGPDAMGSGIGMDKGIAKRLAAGAGIPVVPWIEVRKQFWDRQKDLLVKDATAKLGFPMFVKPARLGSSVGISKVKEASQLVKACETAFEFDDKILIEKGLDIREIECAVLGDYDPECSIVGEVNANTGFYDYESKYLDPNAATIKVPADLTEAQSKEVQRLAKQIFQALELYGMSRVDLFLDKSGKFYLNEVNTIPGFTEVSQYPMLWAASGLKAPQLLDRLIALALQRQQSRRHLKTSR